MPDGVDEAARRWFLTRAERGGDVDVDGDGRPDHGRDDQGAEADDDRPWCPGNRVRPLVHGAEYFAALHAELCALAPGDRVWFTDWRGDADQLLLPGGPTVGDLLADVARRGVEVRGLLWRSHGEALSSPLSARANSRLGRRVNDAGGEALLDQRVSLVGSHHQKLFVVRRRDDPARDVAFVGGLDLCHSRRDDADHHGDPQALDLDPRYGPRPPWHDLCLELRGPVVADLLAVFAERWDDPHPLDHRTPLGWLSQRAARMPRHPRPLPQAAPPPPEAGPHAVQVLRTYGRRRPRFPFAPHGERSIARAYEKAFARARSLIYVEDQYLWSVEVVGGLARALAEAPDLQLLAVVPRYPDSDGRLSGPPNRLGQQRALAALHAAAPGRVGVYDLENEAGTPIYVHAKACVIDDTWMTVGSDNVNRRSWTNDSELTCAVLDATRDGRAPADPAGTGLGARVLARDLRLRLWAEHLGLAEDDPSLLDPAAGPALWAASAAALEAWHAGGRRGPRPPGRVRVHRPEPVTRLQRLWAAPVYRFGVDPDDRPRALRRAGRF